MARLADYFIVVGYDHEKTGRCGCAQRCPAVPGRSPRSCPAPAPARLRPGRGRRRLRRTRGARPAGGGGGEGSGASQGLSPLSPGGSGGAPAPPGRGSPGPPRPPAAAAAPSRSAGRFKRGPRPCRARARPAVPPGPHLCPAGCPGEQRGLGGARPVLIHRPGNGARGSAVAPGGSAGLGAFPRASGHVLSAGGKGSAVICWRSVGEERVVRVM